MPAGEKGSALTLMLLITALILLVIPVILQMSWGVNAQHINAVHRQQVIQMAVSSMQNIVHYPVDDPDLQKAYLEAQYGYREITTPEGEKMDLYQYAVDPEGSSDDYTDRIHDFQNWGSDYEPVVIAVMGDEDQDQTKDENERAFIINTCVGTLWRYSNENPK